MLKSSEQTTIIQCCWGLIKTALYYEHPCPSLKCGNTIQSLVLCMYVLRALHHNAECNLGLGANWVHPLKSQVINSWLQLNVI